MEASKTTWNDIYYVKIYELVRQGFGRRKVGQMLGISINTLRYWHETKPVLAEVIERARAQREMEKVEQTTLGTEPFFDFVYKRLPEDLIPLWDELEELGKGKNAQDRVRRAMEGRSVRAKQHMFVHAMVVSNFSITEAIRLTGIPRTTWEWWTKDDMEFVRLMEEVIKLKKDWVESALMNLIKKGDKTAVIFANKTLNRDRGYDPKVTVKIEGDIRHVHGHVDLDKLPLDLETKRKLLEAYRMAKPPEDDGEGPRVVEALPAHDDD